MGKVGKLLFVLCFSIEFFSVMFFTFLNNVCPDQIQKSPMFNKKELQSLK